MSNSDFWSKKRSLTDFGLEFQGFNYRSYSNMDNSQRNRGQSPWQVIHHVSHWIFRSSCPHALHPPHSETSFLIPALTRRAIFKFQMNCVLLMKLAIWQAKAKGVARLQLTIVWIVLLRERNLPLRFSNTQTDRNISRKQSSNIYPSCTDRARVQKQTNPKGKWTKISVKMSGNQQNRHGQHRECVYTSNSLDVRGKNSQNLSHLHWWYWLGPDGCDQKSRILEQCVTDIAFHCEGILWEMRLSYGAEEILPTGHDMSKLCRLEHVVVLAVCFMHQHYQQWV